MVKIINVKPSVNNEGKPFFSFLLMGGVEPIQSQQTGKFYLTAKTCYIPTTFDEHTALGLIGTQLPGTVERVGCEPYQYTIKDTGEVVTLSHTYQYVPTENNSVNVLEVKAPMSSIGQF